MAKLEIKIGGDSTGFDAEIASVEARAAKSQKELAANQERWLKRERQLNGLTAKERRAEVLMRGQLEQNERNIKARALRRERAEAREAARIAATPPVVAPPKIPGQAEKGGSMFGGIGKRLAAMFGTAFVVAKANQFVHALDAMVERILAVSESLGVSTKFFQGWEFAAGQSNVKTETATSGLEKLSINLGKAQEGSAEAAAAFKRYGIDVYTAGGGLKSTEQILFEVSAALNGAETDAQRTAMAVALMGKGAQKLLPMLRGGPEELRKLMAQAKVLAQEDAATLDLLSDSWKQVKSEFMSGSGAIVASFARMTMGAIGLGDAIKKALGGGGSGDVFSSLKNLAGFLSAAGLGAFAPQIAKMLAGPAGPAGEQHGPDLPTPASDDALDARDEALEDLSAEGETSQQKLKRLNDTFARLQHQMQKMWPGSAGRVAKETEAIGIATKIKALEKEIADKKPEKEKDATKSPLNISTDQATRVGAYIGGMQPGMVANILGRQHLTEAQKARVRLDELVRIARSNVNANGQSGWD